MARAMWLFYLSKVIDLADTVSSVKDTAKQCDRTLLKF